MSELDRLMLIREAAIGELPYFEPNPRLKGEDMQDDPAADHDSHAEDLDHEDDDECR